MSAFLYGIAKAVQRSPESPGRRNARGGKSAEPKSPRTNGKVATKGKPGTAVSGVERTPSAESEVSRSSRGRSEASSPVLAEKQERQSRPKKENASEKVSEEEERASGGCVTRGIQGLRERGERESRERLCVAERTQRILDRDRQAGRQAGRTHTHTHTLALAL